METKPSANRYKPINETCMRDLLYNMHTESGASDEYRKAIIVGTLGTILAYEPELTFGQAITRLVSFMPNDGARIWFQSVPDAWFADIATEMRAQGKSYINPV